MLVDEVLTPDSSRFWPAKEYEIGRSQQSYDKVRARWSKQGLCKLLDASRSLTLSQQYLRDWLVSSGSKGNKGVSMPEQVVADTARKYEEAYELLTGGTL